MKSWTLVISLLLNLVLLWLLVFLNDRYGLWAKVQRVALEEGRVPGLVSQHEWNRNYQVRREMFRLDRNQAARVLMLGDSLTAQGEWNAMLGVPLVANRGVDGDTSAGVLARIGDDADFRGDTLVIWIGTNDVLQGGSAAPVAERIMEAARGKAAKLKAGRPTADSGGLIADSEATSQRRTDSKGLIAGRPKLVPSSATVDALDAGRSTCCRRHQMSSSWGFRRWRLVGRGRGNGMPRFGRSMRGWRRVWGRMGIDLSSWSRCWRMRMGFCAGAHERWCASEREGVCGGFGKNEAGTAARPIAYS